MAKKKKVAEESEGPAYASLNPDEMLSGGLKDNFRGRIVEARYCSWDYDGNIPEPVLAARLKIQPLTDDGEIPEDEDEAAIFTQHWSAGDLNNFVPSEDGKEAAEPDDDGNVEGPFALRVGKRTGLNNNTNFAHLMQTIITAGEASKEFTRKQLTGSLDCLEGLDAHWDRVPQRKRSGMVDDEEGGEKKRGRDVLVVSEVFGYGEDEGAKKSKKVKAKAKAAEEDDEDDEDEEEEAPKSKKTAKPSKPAKKAKDEDDEEDDEEDEEEGDEDEAEEDEDEEEGDDVSPLDMKLRKVVLKAIGAAPGKKLKKGKLATVVLNAMAQDKDKSKAVKRVTADEFLENGPWSYDEDNGTLTPADEDDE